MGNRTQKNNHSSLLRIVIIYVLILVILAILFRSTNLRYKATFEGDLKWEATLYFNESGGKSDSVIFGEAIDANDGPPADIYDSPRPPVPPPPYIYAWFDDGLSPPFNTLLKDFRSYPDIYKVWNLSVQWIPSDYVTSTSITISWNISILGNSEYTSVILYDDEGNLLRDMYIQNSYIFTCTAMTPQSFKIICELPNNPPETPSKPSGEIDGNHGTSYTYSTTTTDLDGNDISYFFDWDDGTNSGWIGPYTIGEICSTSHAWQSPGTYNISVKAKDVYGDESYWSPYLLINMINRAPNTPNNPSPVNGAIGVDTNTALSWIDGDLDTGDIVTYDVYFGIINPPPKVISKQSRTSFTPYLNAETTYYWQIIAWDNHGAFSTGPVWLFTTKSSTGPGPSPPEPNIAPTSNASASETVGLVDSILKFDGSQSIDQDGYIKDWSWDFGDGTQSYGEIVTHTYSDSGIYNVILTVTDNEDAKDDDSIIVTIGIANNPPSNPIISGETSGNKNVEYQFIATSTDKDNDSISYNFNWGDGTTSTSEFLPNSIAYAVNHSWASAGKYTIGVTATDNQTTSEQSEIIILIDAHYLGGIGYVIDIDEDGIFDIFYNKTTAIETAVKHQYDETYLIDTNGNGNWDYTYKQTTETIVPFKGKTINEIPWTVIALILVALAVISLIIYFYKKGYF
ncbi:MAG: PKD domain-containing protein [Thermoplasmatales archaeon]|nr:MAG: PKD domain-containing protein [Thermoplasmatales archaeon]